MEGMYIEHHGIKGQKWGVRRFQNEDGSLTPEGRARYDTDGSRKDLQKKINKASREFEKARDSWANKEALYDMKLESGKYDAKLEKMLDASRVAAYEYRSILTDLQDKAKESGYSVNKISNYQVLKGKAIVNSILLSTGIGWPAAVLAKTNPLVSLGWAAASTLLGTLGGIGNGMIPAGKYRVEEQKKDKE